MIQYLIEHGANVHDTMNQHGSKYLIRACEPYIKYLTKYGVDVNKKAVMRIKINGIKNDHMFDKLEYDAYDYYSFNHYEDKKKVLGTPLIIACKYGNLDLVKYLIKHGANVNEEMEDGNTALIVACRFVRCNYNTTIIKYLIEQGADINKKGLQYMKLNKRYESYNDTEFIEATPLILACLYENDNMIEYLVEHGANINEKISIKKYYIEENISSLSVAFKFNNKNMIKYLIEHGANINEKIDDDSTPLIKACEYKYEDIVEYLVDHGANINEKRYDQISALSIAFEFQNTNIIKYLIEHGANVNEKMEYDVTPLIEAYKYFIIN